MTHMEFAHPYFGAFVMFVVTFTAFGATVWLARFVSRKIARLDTEKLKTTLYECGPEVTKQPNTISTQFYLMALLFILFDVEIIFMFPWAVIYKTFIEKGMALFVFTEMVMFVVLLAIGFLYAWKKGALEWHSIK